MTDDIQREPGPGIAERVLGGWRIVAAAWLVAMAFVVLLAGVQTLVSRRDVPEHSVSLAGAVIPRHDPSCAGPGDATTPVPQECQIDHSAFDRFEADAYSGW